MTIGSFLIRGRGAMLEFLPHPTPEALAEQIVAFSNGMGGTIVLGVDAEGHATGDAADDLEPIFVRALGLCAPAFRPLELPEWSVQDTSGGQVVTVTVRPVPSTLRTARGVAYVRSGALNVRLSPEQARPAGEKPPAPDFEGQTMPDATLDDLDEAVIEEYERNRARRGARADAFTRLDLLRDAGAVDADGRPTAAGVLLFGRHPGRFFPQMGVILVRFRGTSLRDAAVGGERYARRVEIVGPAARVVERTWAALLEEIDQQPVVLGLERRERHAYPLEAVREAVVNAVCHRDYGIRGQRIELRLFDDRLEIMSPGGLPGHITLDNILDEHYSRNPRLVRGLFYWGYIEELGQGVDIIYEAMRRDHHPAPEFRDTGRVFTVTLYNAVDDLEAEYEGVLNERQILALRYLGEHERITNRTYQALCTDVSSETLRLDLRDMVEKGFLLKIGDKRGTFYVRK
ncbi:MAG: transcriptional regulator [Chloroflexi bacterium]|nr:transcriptional regulator [Chloroflexota bacterium]